MFAPLYIFLGLFTNALADCTTPRCQNTATFVDGFMDKCIDPCSDFEQYTCGKFKRTSTILPSQIGVGSRINLQIANLKKTIELLKQQTARTTAGSFENKMKNLFYSCRNSATLTTRGAVTEYTQAMQDAWPTLNTHWSTRHTFNQQLLFEDHESNFEQTLLKFDLFTDVHNSERRYILDVIQSDFMIDTNVLIHAPKSSPQIQACMTYYSQVAQALGANKVTADADASAWIDFLKNWSKILIGKEHRFNFSMTVNPSTLGQMDTDFPYLNWTQLAEKVFMPLNIAIGLNQKVNVKAKLYFEKLGPLLAATPERVIQNTFGFARALKYHEGVTNQMIQIKSNFDTAISGTGSAPNRTEYCAQLVDKLYDVGMAKLAAATQFDSNANTFVENMVTNIKAAYSRVITRNIWLSQSTRDESIRKVNAITSKIGVQSRNFNDAYIDQLYSGFTVDRNNFNGNRLQNTKQSELLKLTDLNMRFAEVGWKWRTSMTEANAFYKNEVNEIVFPLGIIQPPFFDPNAPGFFNYGAFGSFVAHEISHSYSLRGTHFDARGQLRDWWSSADKARLATEMKCFVEQSNKYKVEEVNLYINGQRTVRENMADTVGSVLAYEAYQEYLKTNTDSTLPDMTAEQSFFIATAIPFCVKFRTPVLMGIVQNQNWSPFRYRILGRAHNSKEFTQAFNCPVGSKMRPKKRCVGV